MGTEEQKERSAQERSEVRQTLMGAIVKIDAKDTKLLATRVGDYRHLRFLSNTHCHWGRRGRSKNTTDD